MRNSILAGLVAALLMSGAASGATISGHVTDERGVALPGVDLDFVVVATGNSQSANNDVTDASGNYATAVPNAVYDVSYTPPVGTRFAGHVQRNVNLTVNQTVAVVLRDAWLVSGTVIRADNGLPAVGVDLDFHDLASGLKIFTPHDATDLSGHYSVAVPKGIYRVNFDGPEPGLPTDPPQLAPTRYDEISVTGAGDFALATVTMAPGFAVNGEVLDAKGDGIVNGDLDVFVAGTPTPVYTVHDNTDNRGRYSTVLPAGTYDLKFDPPPGSLSVSKLRVNVGVSAAISLGTETLADGWLLQGLVKDPDSALLAGVDLDFESSSTHVPVPAEWDDTNAAGHYATRIGSGTYDIRFGPNRSGLVVAHTQPSVVITSNRTLADVVLAWRETDGDAVPDVDDRCPFVGDPTQLDGDMDGIGNGCDNCLAVSNPRQENGDLDGLGDACDADDDNDGVVDGSDPDDDNDGVPDSVDVCPTLRDPQQFNRDADAQGDACDPNDGEVEWITAAGRGGFVARPETGATSYRLYRQTRSLLSTIDYGTCRFAEHTSPVFPEPEVPEAGECWVYLATAVMATGEGGLGRNGGGTDRPNLRACP